MAGLGDVAAFIRKDMVIALSYKLQFLFQFSQVFFAVAIIYFVGKLVAGSGASRLLTQYGADYFSFALVGLAVTSYLRAGLVTMTNDTRQVMNQGTLEAVFAAPVGYMRLLLCSALWPFLFETVRVGAYFVIGRMVFGMRLLNANWGAALVVMILTIPIFLLLGVISTSILILVKRGDPVNWFFSSLSSLLAGTVFPIAVLPGWLGAAAMFLPLTHSLEAMRRTLLMGTPLIDIRGHLAALIAFVSVLIPLTILVNRVCMARAKKRGAFTTH